MEALPVPLFAHTFLTAAVVCLLLSGGACYEEREQAADAEGRNLTKLYKRNLQQLVRIIDDTVNACDDFYAHACGNYDRLFGGAVIDNSDDVYSENEETVNDVVQPFLYNKEDQMHFFDEQYKHFVTRPGKILAQLYSECKSRNEWHVLSAKEPLRQWVRMIKEVDFLAANGELYASWPYLQHQWARVNRQHKLNWVTLAAQFAAHGLPSLLNIYFAEDTIFIAPVADLQCPSLSDFQLSLAPVLAERNAQIGHIIGHELRVFCRSLRGELPLDVSQTIANGSASENILIDDNIVEYFQHFFGLLNFTAAQVEQARKLPMDVERTANILQALQQTEPRIIFNYVMWQAYERLKYDDCYLLTEEFERLLLAEYWHWDIFESHYRRNVAMAMYLYHTTRFQKQRKELLMGTDWYKFLMAPLERKDFNIARIIQAHANSYLNVQQLNTTYAALQLKPDAFYANLLQLRKLKLRAAFATPLIDNEDHNHPAYFLRQFLDFCIIILKQPIFHYYATQGFELWHTSNLLFDTDGYYTALDCLERQSLLHIDDEPNVFRVLNTHEVSEVFSFYRAFVESHNDYNFWLEGESFAFAEDFILQYFKLDTKRILFYATAQLYCNRNEHLYSAQINRSFMNMPAFHDAFNCSAETPMHPVTKCMISQCV